MTTKVLVTIDVDDELVEQLNNISEDLEINVIPAKQGSDIPEEIWQRTEVLFTLSCLPELEQAPKLRWIQSYYAGVDLITESSISEKADLMITSLSGGNAQQVAEYCLLMLLSLGHQLPDLIAAQNRSIWLPNKYDVYKPQELSESTIGIIGYGSIGRQIARLLYGFGSQVLVTKRNIKDPIDSGYTPEGIGDPRGDYFTRMYPPEATISMLKECDYVVVTLPLTNKTRGSFNTEHFEAMKPSAFVIDISRGGVINHEDLLNALAQHKIAGAGLDVFPQEPLPADNLLWQMPNVIVTPHVAGISVHYSERAVELFSENLKLYLDRQPLLNQVDPKLGY